MYVVNDGGIGGGGEEMTPSRFDRRAQEALDGW